MNQFNVTYPHSRTHIREFMRGVNKQKIIMTYETLGELFEENDDIKKLKEIRDIVNEDLHCIFTDKTSGETNSITI